MKTAAILTTYNRPDALAAALEGYLAQQNARFELIVADDGSTEETRRVVDDYAARAPFPVKHVWQEDRGFRAGAVRNRALAHTDAEYVIFSDGDCVPPASYVARHVELAERGWFLSGSRILLSEDFTRRVLASKIPIHRWSAAQWLLAWMRRDVNRALPLLTRDLQGDFRKQSPQRWEGVKTCNFSAWREDLVRANGFDERYAGWGLEDSDLVIRLLHAGVQHKSARFAAPVFHLWHRENDRTQLSENRKRLDEIMASQRVAAIEGLDRHS